MSLSQPVAAPAALRDTTLDIEVLRALLRLARRRTAPTLDQLVVRVGADEASVRRSLVVLARDGLVQRTPAGLRLSLPGLAVAVAYATRATPVGAPRPIRQAPAGRRDAA